MPVMPLDISLAIAIIEVAGVISAAESPEEPVYRYSSAEAETARIW
jgi:hypothetical protein